MLTSVTLAKKQQTRTVTTEQIPIIIIIDTIKELLNQKVEFVGRISFFNFLF